MTKAIRVVLADDHAVVREALAQFLDESASVEVVGQVADGHHVLELAADAIPDVVVLDYNMPQSSALSTIEALGIRFPKIKILVLTVHESTHYAVKVLESGAHGYVVKSAAATELIDAIRAVQEGEVYVSPRVSRRILQHLRQPRKERRGLEALSPREFEIMRLLALGMSLKECVNQLHISASSAQTYRARLVEKLKLDSTPELICFALENDIVG